MKFFCEQSNNAEGRSPSEYMVLYPFYDIRFYNHIGDEGVPAQVRQACKGDKCACLIKTGEVGFIDAHVVCGLSLDYGSCIEGKVPVKNVYSCFNLQQLRCSNELWFAAGKEAPIRDYAKGESKTCKYDGVIKWDKTGFFYDKRSEECVGSG